MRGNFFRKYRIINIIFDEDYTLKKNRFLNAGYMAVKDFKPRACQFLTDACRDIRSDAIGFVRFFF